MLSRHRDLFRGTYFWAGAVIAAVLRPELGLRSDRNMAVTQMQKVVIDSTRLLYFYQVGRLGSFSKAEAALAVSQSSLSRQVRVLETEIKAVLLERHGRGVTLTHAGQIVFDQAEKIFGIMNDLHESIEINRADPSGQVTIGVLPSLGGEYLGPVIRKFQATYPRVLLRVWGGSSSHVHDWLIRGDVDLAINVSSGSLPEVLMENLFTERLYLIGAPRTFPKGRHSITLGELEGYRLVLSSAPYGYRRFLEALAARSRVKLTAALEVDSPALMKSLIGAPPYCTISSGSDYRMEIEAGTLRAIALKPKVARTIALAQLKGRPTTMAARLLAHEIRKHVSVHAKEHLLEKNSVIGRPKKGRRSAAGQESGANEPKSDGWHGRKD